MSSPLEPSAGIGHVNKLSAALSKLKGYYMSGDTNSIMVDIPAVQPVTITSTGETYDAIVMDNTDVGKIIVDNLNNVLLDLTEGAYFTKDMITDDNLYSKFSSHTPIDITARELPSEGASQTSGQEGVEKFVKIVFENDYNHAGGKTPDSVDFAVTTAKAPHSSTAASALGDDATNASISLLVRSRRDPAVSADYKSGFTVNANPDEPDRYTYPTLAAFMMPNLRVCPQTRGTEAISIFCNSIPPIEMSRCVPLIKIQFVSATAPTPENKRRQLTLLNFLGLNEKTASGASAKQEQIGFEEALPTGIEAETGLALAFLYESTTKNDVVSLSAAGMELFTSPQTLVNMNIGSTSPTRTPVLDLLQPLMSLENLKIQIAGLGQSIHANKTGTMTFVLHDRSRMADIAALIAADTFAQTYLVINYGWSHPDGNNPDKNAFGALLNSMRCVSAFNIVSTTLNMGQDGQVRFTMKLASRGREEIKIYPIATGEVMPTAPMKSIIENFLSTRLVEGTQGEGATSSREVRQKIALSMSDARSASSSCPRSLFLEFQNLVAKPNLVDVEGGQEVAPASLDRLNEILVQLVGDPENPDDDGEIALTANSLVREATAKIQAMLDTPDPFFPNHIPTSVSQDIGWVDQQTAAATGATMTLPVSLGKILTVMVGGSLAGTGKFDEVQMFFYRFGNQAGAARDYESIANFLIDHTTLYSEFQKFITGYPSMSVEGFINMINEKFIEKNANPNYGLMSEFATAASVTGEDQQPDMVLDDMFARALMNIYADGGGKPELRVPKLRMTFECLPAFIKSTDQSQGPNFKLTPEKVILRVHIFDQNATPHEDELFLLECANDSELAVMMGSSSSTSNTDQAEGRTPNGVTHEVFSKAANEGIITKISEVTSNDISLYTAGVSNTVIKKVIKATVPSMTFGLGTSAIKSMNISSTTQGSVNNVLLHNTITEDKRPGEPEAATVPMEDVFVIPASMTMNIIGCPMFEYGQQFFVDCGTGTTIDNMYGVTGINHTLSPGTFETQINLGFMGSGTVRNFRTLLTAAMKRVDEQAREDAQTASTNSEVGGEH